MASFDDFMAQAKAVTASAKATAPVAKSSVRAPKDYLVPGIADMTTEAKEAEYDKAGMTYLWNTFKLDTLEEPMDRLRGALNLWATRHEVKSDDGKKVYIDGNFFSIGNRFIRASVAASFRNGGIAGVSYHVANVLHSTKGALEEVNTILHGAAKATAPAVLVKGKGKA